MVARQRCENRRERNQRSVGQEINITKAIICDKGEYLKEESINFVDDQNRFVGYSRKQQCCELADYGIFDSQEKLDAAQKLYREIDKDVHNKKEVRDKVLENAINFDSSADVNSLLKDYRFRRVQTKEHEKNGIFELEGDKDIGKSLWIMLINIQNGAYNHGFYFFNGKETEIKFSE